VKKIGEYTIRGKMAEGVEEKLQLFDGRFDTAYKVVDIKIASSDVGSSGDDCVIRLSTESIGQMPASGESMIDFSDNRQIAWCGFAAQANGFDNVVPIIDTDNLIVEDLFISGQAGSTHPINYMIFLEKYDITEWQGALAMVRNSAQNV
jgi:hypothetical protein